MLLNLRLHQCHLSPAKSVRYLTASKLREYYDLLKVDKNSSTKEIKESFLRLSKLYHPDNKTTGSHAKFVNLKQAYDAIKDGPPATTPTSNTYSRYSNTYGSMNQKTHDEYQRQRYEYHKAQESRRRGTFGGMYSGSETPWEDMMKERERRRASYGGRVSSNYFRSVVILSLFFYMFVISGVRLLFDRNENVKRRLHLVNVRRREEYEEYEKYLKERSDARKENIKRMAEKHAKLRYVPESKPTEELEGARDTLTPQVDTIEPNKLDIEFIK